MISTIAQLFDLLLQVVRPLVFVSGVIAAAGAVTSWAVRTRRISPFSPIARFARSAIDPWLITPMERRVVRAGGMPYAAPWWALALVVVGGLLLISAVQFVRDQFLMLAFASTSGRSLLAVLVRWSFSILRIGLFARVVASWVGGSPYSPRWRWCYTLTEWFLAPLRQVIPTIGMIDISVLVAYFGMGILERMLISIVMR